MMNTLLVVCLVVLICAVWAARGDAEGEPGQQSPGQLHVSLPVRMSYLIYLPPDYPQHEAWPLLLFLHGAGERGDDLELVKLHGPPKLIAEGKEFPFVVISPQCPADESWQAVNLTALLDDVVSKYRIDERRMYVTGLSMGGFGTWSLACHTPHRFAALAPICGGGETFRTDKLVDIPTWVFHGAKDDVVALQRSQEMVDALKQQGGNVRFTIYPDAEHDSWTATYDNPDLYRWLAEQRRSET
jgi:predicted peptidase